MCNYMTEITQKPFCDKNKRLLLPCKYFNTVEMIQKLQESGVEVKTTTEMFRYLPRLVSAH